MALSEQSLHEPVEKHMRRDVARLPQGATVAEALELLRREQPSGRIIYFYVIDAEGRLCGVIPTRALLLSRLETHLSDIMVRKVVAIPATATVLEACEFFVLHRFLAFPVVDEQNRLIGAVDIELYTEELQSIDGEQPDDLFQLVGVHLARARKVGVRAAFRNRFPWLMCNIVGGILAALLSGLYREELDRVVALALFIPVVLALAESVSVQSVSLALQLLHGRQPSWKLFFNKLGGELLVGFSLGTASGFVVGAVVLLWLGQVRLVWCVIGGILVSVTVAAALGAALPYLLRRLKLDPYVAAGPMVLPMADLLSLFVYFSAARWLLPPS